MPRPGTTRPGSSSASGSSANRRSWRRGCGTVSPGSSITCEPKSRRSRSIARGPVARPRAALAPEAELDLEQEVEQPARVELRIDLRRRVEERRLIGVAPGLGLSDLGKPPGADPFGSLPDSPLAVAEIRAEPDVRAGHGRSTVTAEYSAGGSSWTCGFRTRTRTRSTGKRPISSSAIDAASVSSSCTRRRSETSRTHAATSR